MIEKLNVYHLLWGNYSKRCYVRLVGKNVHLFPTVKLLFEFHSFVPEEQNAVYKRFGGAAILHDHLQIRSPSSCSSSRIPSLPPMKVFCFIAMFSTTAYATDVLTSKPSCACVLGTNKAFFYWNGRLILAGKQYIMLLSFLLVRSLSCICSYVRNYCNKSG